MPVSKSEKLIKDSLIEQLKLKGADVACFTDLVNDYMRFWAIKNALISDIKSRGVVYKDFSSVGIEMQKNNPSVKELVNVSKQMQSTLDKLGISTDKCKAPPDYSDDEIDL